MLDSNHLLWGPDPDPNVVVGLTSDLGGISWDFQDPEPSATFPLRCCF